MPPRAQLQDAENIHLVAILKNCSLLSDPGKVCASLATRLGQKSLAANVVVFMKRSN